MSDFISRQKISYAVKSLGEDYISQYKILMLINQMPSIEPKRKKGEWVYDGIRGRFPACKCSICGHYENADWALLQGANYCPNCGADMRGNYE